MPQRPYPRALTVAPTAFVVRQGQVKVKVKVKVKVT